MEHAVCLSLSQFGVGAGECRRDDSSMVVVVFVLVRVFGQEEELRKGKERRMEF